MYFLRSSGIESFCMDKFSNGVSGTREKLPEDLKDTPTHSYDHHLFITFSHSAKAGHSPARHTRKKIEQLIKIVNSEVARQFPNIEGEIRTTTVPQSWIALHYDLAKSLDASETEDIALLLNRAFEDAKFGDIVVALAADDPSRKNCSGQRTEFIISRGL